MVGFKYQALATDPPTKEKNKNSYRRSVGETRNSDPPSVTIFSDRPSIDIFVLLAAPPPTLFLGCGVVSIKPARLVFLLFRDRLESNSVPARVLTWKICKTYLIYVSY